MIIFYSIQLEKFNMYLQNQPVGQIAVPSVFLIQSYLQTLRFSSNLECILFKIVIQDKSLVTRLKIAFGCMIFAAESYQLYVNTT